MNWIEKPPNRQELGVLVSNRIIEIRKIVQAISEIGPNTYFGYIATQLNPADAGTRGVSKDKFTNHSWWTGPQFLQLHYSMWNKNLYQINNTNCSIPTSCYDSAVLLLRSNKSQSSDFPWERFSTFTKAQRVVAWVFRFLRNAMRNLSKPLLNRITNNIPELMPTRIQTKPLTGEEMRSARMGLVRIHQLSTLTPEYIKTANKSINLFKEKDGILRVRGRLGRSSLPDETKFPFFIAPRTPIAEKIIQKAHGRYHRGIAHTIATVREEFWIPKLRQQSKTLIQKCIKCKRFNGLPYRYPELTDLPERRVQRSQPFEHIGLDFFDLPLVNDNNEEIKTYGCIFTCAVTRLIHLEVLKSMDTNNFLHAMRRFFSRRGIPNSITCDNAPTFLLSADILNNAIINDPVSDILANKEIEWKTITPYAPWQGGFYERLIKSVKHALYKSLSKSKILFDNLTTIMTEIEATLNTRPLTYQEDESEEFCSLRPIDFIQKDIKITFPFQNIQSDSSDPEYLPSTDFATLRTKKQLKKLFSHPFNLLKNFGTFGTNSI